MSKLKTKEELEAMGIDLTAENNNELHPSVNRTFVLKCRRCECENAKTVVEVREYNEEMHEISYEDFYYCPNCKLKVSKYTI